MTGNSIGEFIDDLLMMGGPEKEFIFRNKLFFLETTCNNSNNLYELHIDEYDTSDPKTRKLLCSYYYEGQDFAECVHKFEDAKIFDSMNIYQAEQEINVLFG